MRKTIGFMILLFAGATMGCTEVHYLRNLTREQEKEINQLRKDLAQAKSERIQAAEPLGAAQPSLPAPPPAAQTDPYLQQSQPQTLLAPAPISGTATVPPAPSFSSSAAAPTAIPAATPAPMATPAAPTPFLDAIQRNLEVVLGEAIRQGQIALESGSGKLAVVIGSDLVFDEAGRVSPRIEPYLKAVGDQAAKQPRVSMIVEAYGSGLSAPATSSQQAQNVADFLTGSSGLAKPPMAYGRASAPAGLTPEPDRVRIVLEER